MSFTIANHAAIIPVPLVNLLVYPVPALPHNFSSWILRCYNVTHQNLHSCSIRNIPAILTWKIAILSFIFVPKYFNWDIIDFLSSRFTLGTITLTVFDLCCHEFSPFRLIRSGETIHGSTVSCSFQATPHSEGNQRCMTLEVKKCSPVSAMHSSGIYARSDEPPQVCGKNQVPSEEFPLISWSS